MNEIVDFEWYVPKGGYVWADGRRIEQFSPGGKEIVSLGEPERVLISVTEFEPMVAYSPLTVHTGLFRTFAETPPNEEAVLAFANTYGCLGEGDFYLVSGTRCIGEPASLWYEEIGRMRRLVDLWDAVRARDTTKLEEVVEWEGDKVFVAEVEIGDLGMTELDGEPTRIITQYNSKYAPELRHGDPILPALYYLIDSVNGILVEGVAPALLWDPGIAKTGLYLKPDSLLHAVWLQFALAIDGEKEYRQCEECRTWFELSPEVARTSKLYCSNACRSRAYRKRQAEARRLHDAGKSIEEIAQALGTDVRTAQGWITRGGSTGGGKSREER